MKRRVLEDLGDNDIALGPHLEEKTDVVLVPCHLLVLLGTTKSTRNKSQEEESISVVCERPTEHLMK